MLDLNLELRYNGENQQTQYHRVDADAPSVYLAFTSVRGEGYVNVYRKRGDSVIRLDTIALYGVNQRTRKIDYHVKTDDQLGFELKGSGQAEFAFTLGVSTQGDQNASDPGIPADLLERLERLEQLFAGIGSGDGDDADLKTRIGVAENKIRVLENASSRQSEDVSTLTDAVNTARTDLGSRLAELETKVASGTGTGGTSAPEKVEALTASKLSSPYTLDASKLDRVDLSVDRGHALTITGIRKSTPAEYLTIARMTSGAGGTTAISGVDVWTTPDQLPPKNNVKAGFGEIIYLTNMHGRVFGSVKEDVQFRYHAHPADLAAAYAFTERSGQEASALNAPARKLILGGTSSPEASDPGWRSDGGVNFGGQNYLVENVAGTDIDSFQIFFSLGSLASGDEQRLLTITENSDSNWLALAVRERDGILDFSYRLKSDLKADFFPIGSVAAGTLYSLTVRTDLGSSPSAEAILTRVSDLQETRKTFTNFDPTDRRDSTSRVFVGSTGDPNNFLKQGGHVRGLLLYKNQLALPEARANIESFL